MHLKYFLPDWDDRLDQDFDFINDSYSVGHIKDPYGHDSYAHQLLDYPPYDGLLISLSIFESKLKLGNFNVAPKIRDKENIRAYLKIPRNSKLKVMGDCGAFSYVDKKEPPLPFYSVENIATLYEKLGFDYGVSVDHLVMDYILTKDKETGKRKKRFLSEEEKKERIKITIRNAEKFKAFCEDNRCNFIPIGVAQGYDTVTYIESVNSLINLGYEYLAIGGLVQYTSEFILNLLKELQPFIKDRKVHLFGILRPKHLKTFEEMGVSSFDSASFFRKAWLKSEQNYLSAEGKWYSAIRVPQSSNPRLMKNADINGFSSEDLKRMEKDALQALIQYDEGKVDINYALNTVLEYDNLLLRGTSDVKNLKPRYMRTLSDMPWRSCNCSLCKKLGIQIIIFRGCNRNKRRGFHNVWAFRQLSQNDEQKQFD